MESKRRKAEECVKKADVEYYTVCLRAERSRLEWESAIVRGSHCFQVCIDTTSFVTYLLSAIRQTPLQLDGDCFYYLIK